MRIPRTEVTGPVLDAADPVGLAHFYEQLLGWTMVEQSASAIDGTDSATDMAAATAARRRQGWMSLTVL